MQTEQKPFIDRLLSLTEIAGIHLYYGIDKNAVLRHVHLLVNHAATVLFGLEKKTLNDPLIRFVHPETVENRIVLIKLAMFHKCVCCCGLPWLHIDPCFGCLGKP